MNFNSIPAGENIPEDIYVIIEISQNSNPVKYEINKNNGTIFVDRFIPTPMFYPCNYGYINQTLALDGDPIDVLLPTPFPIHPGTIVRSRPIGILKMLDESGEDSKLIAVPHPNLSNAYNNIKDIEDLPQILRIQIIYFFENYKKLEKDKWTKIEGWDNVHSAKLAILASFKRASSIKNL
ncbi:inorganic diphosphatase [Candidatus Schneideria nysicola]|nr:inorganic diphosphatase [Candidatus Schneideria nysicola]UAJ64798.1 inorganic diphosphatase [Candidatus Schneideria nysicola]